MPDNRHSVLDTESMDFRFCGNDRNEANFGKFNREKRKGVVMEINTKKDQNIVIVSLKGRMDAVTSPDFEKSLSERIAAGESNFLINLGHLEYISSAGLRSILTIAKLLKAKDGKILFAGLRGPVKDVFNISGFGAIFKIFETEEEALKA